MTCGIPIGGQARQWLPVACVLALAGCVTAGPLPAYVRQEAPPPDTNVYFYPAQGHPVASTEQQDRDKYECNTWAVQQTGFDPSLPDIPPHQRVRIVAAGPPPGAGVAGGAVAGAVIGAAVSDPWHAGRGTLIGAIAGAALGGIAEAEHINQANDAAAQAHADANSIRSAVLEQKALGYRRAMTACLEGRGYSVR